MTTSQKRPVRKHHKNFPRPTTWREKQWNEPAHRPGNVVPTELLRELREKPKNKNDARPNLLVQVATRQPCQKP